MQKRIHRLIFLSALPGVMHSLANVERGNNPIDATAP